MIEIKCQGDTFLVPVKLEKKNGRYFIGASKRKKWCLSSRSLWYYHHCIFHLFNAYSLPYPLPTSWILRTALEGVIVSILSMRKLRLRKVKGLTQGHTAGKAMTDFRTCANGSVWHCLSSGDPMMRAPEHPLLSHALQATWNVLPFRPSRLAEVPSSLQMHLRYLLPEVFPASLLSLGL